MVEEIDSDTPDAVRTLLSDYSDVTTISLVNVGGSADDLPDDDPEHDLYLDDHAEMGIDADYYYRFTLGAAPAADIHWMTSDELDTYGVATSG